MKRLVLVLLVLSGCTTPYQKTRAGQGYRDWTLAPGKHRIRVSGNRFTGPKILAEQFHERAMELCRKEGFTSYEGEPEARGQTTYQEPSTYHASTTYVPHGSETTVTEEPGERIRKYVVEGEVTCINHKTRPPGVDAAACTAGCAGREQSCEDDCEGGASCLRRCYETVRECRAGCQ